MTKASIVCCLCGIMVAHCRAFFIFFIYIYIYIHIYIFFFCFFLSVCCLTVCCISWTLFAIVITSLEKRGDTFAFFDLWHHGLSALILVSLVGYIL